MFGELTQLTQNWGLRQRRAAGIGLAVFLAAAALTYADRLGEGKSAFVRWQPQILELLQGVDVYRAYEYPNPPLMAVLLAPLALMPLALGAWLLFALKCVLATVAVAWSVRAVAPQGPPLAAGFAIAGIVLSLRPILSDLQHGNVNILIFFLVMGGLRCLQQGRDASAGLLVGLATALKITPALLLVYFAWKGWWRCCAAFAVAVGVLSLVPALVLGLDQTLELLVSYYEVMLEPFSAAGVVDAFLAPNQSLGAVLQRYLTDLPSLQLQSGRLRFNVASLDLATVRNILRVISLALVAALVWVCRSPAERRGLHIASEYALWLIAMLMISPRSWKHHYVVMALPGLCVLAWSARPEWRAWRPWLFGALALSQLFVLSTSRDIAKLAWFVDEGHHWAQALGAYLFSAVIVGVALAAILVAARRQGYEPSASPR